MPHGLALEKVVWRCTFRFAEARKVASERSNGSVLSFTNNMAAPTPRQCSHDLGRQPHLFL
jgi:hypothetical protein